MEKLKLKAGMLKDLIDFIDMRGDGKKKDVVPEAEPIDGMDKESSEESLEPGEESLDAILKKKKEDEEEDL